MAILHHRASDRVTKNLKKNMIMSRSEGIGCGCVLILSFDAHLDRKKWLLRMYISTVSSYAAELFHSINKTSWADDVDELG